MATWKPDSDARGNDRRLVRGSLSCSLGRVIDLSPTGARISTSRQPEETTIPVEIRDEHDRLCCAARVVWCRRAGVLRYEVGLFFPELDADSAATLRRLLEVHRFPHDYGAVA